MLDKITESHGFICVKPDPQTILTALHEHVAVIQLPQISSPIAHSLNQNEKQIDQHHAHSNRILSCVHERNIVMQEAWNHITSSTISNK